MTDDPLDAMKARWNHIQGYLFPWLREEVDPMTEALGRLVNRNRRHRRNAGRKNRAAEKPPPARLPLLARLDHRAARRLARLLQTARPQNHG